MVMQPDRCILEFARVLRANHIASDPSMVMDAERIAAAGYLTRPRLFRAGLRACFCRDAAQWHRFDTLFDWYWLRHADEREAGDPDDRPLTPSDTSNVGEQRLLGMAGTSGKKQDTAEVFGAGDFKALSLADFRFVFNPVLMREIEGMVDNLARRMRRQFFRKTRMANKGERIDLNRSLHRSIRYRGNVMRFRFQQRQRRLPRYVLLLDISQSMDVYAKLFLRFTRQLMATFEQSEAFAFNTDLVPLGTGFHNLTEADFERTLNDGVKGWLGGTRIAQSLSDFNEHHLQRAVNSRTTVLIFSDGCDTATPQELAAQVQIIQRRSRRLIWVNPLLGRFEVGEKDRNMDPVVPFVDRYRSAHNLASLKLLEADLLS